MGDMENVCVVEIHKDIQKACEVPWMIRKRSRRTKLTLSAKRYSRKKACRERRRRLALQNIAAASTSDGQIHTPEKIIYLPLDEQIETHSSNEISEETTQVFSCEILKTENIEDESIVETKTFKNEEMVIEKTVKIEPEEQSRVSNGLSIVDMQHIFSEFKKIGDHAKNREDCGIRHLQIAGMKRSGLRTTLSVICEMCQYRGEIQSEPSENNQIETEQSAVAGTILTGGGFAQMEEFFAAMNIPPMSRRVFRKHHDEVVKSLIVAAEEEMVAAAEEEKRLAIERGDIVPGLGIPHIPVVADGSWMKRSYRSGTYDSASGVGVIIGYHTKKVLFTGVRNKVCRICRHAVKKNEEPRKHTCFKNWGTNQTSTSMESDAIVEGFRTSVEKRGLVYSTLIADGDSSAYKKILDADPYKSQIRVQKIECTNHLLRNFCRKMREIVKKTPPGPLRRTVESNIRRMRTDIVKAAVFRDSQNVTRAEKIRNLHVDVDNVPSHVFGEHADCSKLQYFCDGTSKQDEKNIVPALTKVGVYEHIKEILRQLLVHAESLLYNSNSNVVESFNGIIVKYTGGKRLNFSERGSYTGRCAAAVLQYNTKQVLSRLNKAMSKKPSVLLRKLEDRKIKENQRSAEKLKDRRIAKYVRKQFRLGEDSDYGPNAQQPDMATICFQTNK